MGGRGSASKTKLEGSFPKDPIDQIESQINATEQKISAIRQKQKGLSDQILGLVKAGNYDKIKANNRLDEQLEKQARSLEKDLSELHRRGRAMYRD